MAWRLRMAACGLAVAACYPAAAADIELRLPLACEVGRTCLVQNYVDHDASSGVRDYACGAQSYDGHTGTDFRLPSMTAQRTGVAVLAVAKGRVLRVRDGVPDISVRVIGKDKIKGRECGNGVVVEHADGWDTQYCHMAQGSVRAKPGAQVEAGAALGLVGLSGDTEFAHVHLTVRHLGKVIDPFAFGAPAAACGGGAALWAADLRAALAYRPAAVLNTGFAARPISLEAIESGEAEQSAPGADAPALVAFVRAIGLRAGDVQRLVLVDPDGQTIVDRTADPLDRNKAQYMFFVGKKRPAGGWRPGSYRAAYSLRRNGAVILEQSFETQF